MSDHHDLFPWTVIIQHKIDKTPRIQVRSSLTERLVRGPDVSRRIEYFIVHSGREFVSINLGVMFSTQTDDYYLGVIVDQPNIPHVHRNVFEHIERNGKWVNRNVHIVLCYISREINCSIDHGNINQCVEQYAIVDCSRFSLRERLKPNVTPHQECGYQDGRRVCYNTK